MTDEALAKRLDDVRRLWLRNIGVAGTVEAEAMCRAYWRQFAPAGAEMPEWMRDTMKRNAVDVQIEQDEAEADGREYLRRARFTEADRVNISPPASNWFTRMLRWMFG